MWGGLIPHIETVQIFNSKVNYKNGKDLGPGLAVIIKPNTLTDKDKDKIAQAISNILVGMKLEDE